MKRVAISSLTAIALGFCALKADAQSQGPEGDVFRIGSGVTTPKLIHKIEPRYSQAALNAGVQGTVLLELVIDQRGLPQNIALLSPLGFGLDERAMECISQWRFGPAMKDGKPVKIRAQIEVNFRLLGRSFDSRAEEERTRFNAILSRLTRQENARPSDGDVQAMQNLAKHKLAAADYVIGMWQLKGDVLPKDPGAGLASIQRAADKNYGPALFFIGHSQMRGDLLPKDPAKGLSLIRDAAVLGSKEAQFTLGGMYEKGDGVAVDVDRAKRYFRLCAASGMPDCQFRLGQLLLASPQRKEEDWLQAIAWLELAKSHNFELAREAAQSETAKLTPEQAQWVARLQSRLEQKP